MNYNTVSRKCFRRKWGVMPPKVQDHHVIPKQWRSHPTVRRYGMDINNSNNIIMMPTNYGMVTMNLRKLRYIHEGGHHSYNKYIFTFLESLYEIEDEETFQKEFKNFHKHLKKVLRNGNTYIPWL